MPTNTKALPSAVPPVDHAQRVRALDAGTSFIVQAPAGSGKTALLTRRILTLLAHVDEPEEILAITFTRKAAAEMRTRVVEALELAERCESPESEFDRQGYDLATAVLARDKQLGWCLLENPDRIRMSTIDALCSMLAQQLPVTSTLGGIANPVDDASNLYREAARRRLSSSAANYRQLLATVGNRFHQAEQLLADMLSRRDQWLRYRVFFDYDDRSALKDWLEGQLSDLVTRELQFFEQLVKEARLDQVLKSHLLPKLQRASEVIEALGGYNPGERELREPFLGLCQMPELTAENLGVWQAVLACLFTKNRDAVRKKVTKAEGFPVAKADIEELGISSDEAREEKNSFVDILKAVADASRVEAAAATVLSLPLPKYSDAQWALLEELLTELSGLEVELHQVFVDHGAIDFIEIATRARIALGAPDAPTDLALAMDLRLKHILVDEFQDTSRSQFELFRQLVAGWQLGDGRTFFAVGDPMQSIYAFRAAKVGLFLDAKNTGISDDVPLEPITLEVNFRSSPDVVNWVNSSFSKIFVPEGETNAMAAIAYSPSVANRSIAGSVSVHPLLNQNADEAGDYVATLVRDTLATPEYVENSDKRIAVLVRSRTAALPIFAGLQRHGIESLSVDMDSLGEQPVVMDLVSLTLALRFPHSRLHWLAVLRAPWCGLGLEDLHTLTSDASTARALPLLINDAERQERLSSEGRHRLDKFLAIVQPAIDRAARSSLVSWVAMDRLFAITPDDGTAKVHIMTMHKSKGLEFDTVILPELNRQPRGGSGQLLNWAVIESGGSENTELLLAPMTERNASTKDKSLGMLVKNLNSANDEQEKKRLLYVACTRAVRHLHLVAPLRVSANGELKAAARSLLEPLWPVLQEEFTTALQDIQIDSTDDTSSNRADDSVGIDVSQKTAPIPSLIRVPKDWQPPCLPNYVFQDDDANAAVEEETHNVDYLWAGRLARAVGIVMHRQMERFHVRGLPLAKELTKLEPVVKSQLRQQGLAKADLTESTKTVIQSLQNVLNDKNGRWLYDSSHTDVRSEWALSAVTHNGLERRVIDRTFISSEGIRWIVDFKTGDHKGGDLEGFLSAEVDRYGPQLRRYAEILSNLESKPVRLALYFPLMQAFREVPLAQEH